MYKIESKPASSKGWFTPSQTKNYYGKYARTGVTVHWWNDPKLIKDSDHDNIVNLMLGRAKRGEAGVANYVVSNKKITNLVHPDNSPWASQNGNATTVSIEFSPHLSAEGYKKGGWLIWQLEKRYNRKLAIYPHNHWVGTACPGTINLKKLRDEANKWAKGAYNPKPAPAPVPKAKLTWSKLKTPKVYVTNKPATNLWDFNATAWNMKSVKTFKKGEKITIYGQVVNETLGATYLLTEYSYLQKITNGFNQADLDPYIEIEPSPTKPPVEEPPAIDPKPEIPADESDFEKRLSKLEKLVQSILDFLKSIFKWG